MRALFKQMRGPVALALTLVSACSSSTEATAEGTDAMPGDSTTDAAPLDGASDTAATDEVTTPPVDVGPPIEPGDPGSADVRFEIRSDKGVHPISPLIYGTNGAPNPTKNRPTIVRSGGNRLTAYNWENNASNAGSDWCYQNDALLVQDAPAGDRTKPGEAVRRFLESARTANAAALVTIPILDHVAADTLGGSNPPECSGDVRKSGSSYLTTRFRKNVLAKGSAFANPPVTTDDSVYEDELVAWTKTTAAGVPVFFSLDNEPDLWADTHAEIHPTKVGYDELVKRNIDAATAIKAAWPEAKVNGFVSYGWAGFTTLQDAPDRAGKGEFVDYYLTKLKAAETTAGKRLVDYLDLHWYPESTGGQRITGSATDTSTVAKRVQAARSLWDDGYVDTSDWISRDALGNKAIRLLPRMKEKIAAGYPGTKLAFTEWNFGGGGHISGAIATADVLGVFGREGVDMANIWWLNGDEAFTEAGLQAFRNFDGAGGAFGDTSIEATTSVVATATVYASIDAANPARVVIVAINKDAASKTAGIRVAHPTTFTKAKMFTITEAGGAKPNAGADVSSVAPNAFHYTMPGHSVSILVPMR